MIRTLLMSLILVVTALQPASAQQVEQHRGSVFAFNAPSGWSVNESSNGVQMMSPDGSHCAYSLVLANMAGSLSTHQLAQFTLSNLGYSALRPVKHRAPWTSGGFVHEAWAFAGAYRGVSVVVAIECAVKPWYGTTSATVEGFHTSDPQNAAFMATLVNSVRPVTMAGYAQNTGVIAPRNTPLDNRATITAGQNRDRARDRSSAGWATGMRGTTRQVDPQTGRVYTRGIEQYDGTVGGYRNPTPGRTDEVLVPARPGE